jgi:hypothetical protein
MDHRGRQLRALADDGGSKQMTDHRREQMAFVADNWEWWQTIGISGRQLEFMENSNVYAPQMTVPGTVYSRESHQWIL